MFPVQTAITVNFCSILNKLVLMRKGAANARTKQATAPGRVVDRIGWSISAIGCNRLYAGWSITENVSQLVARLRSDEVLQDCKFSKYQPTND